MSKLRFLRNPVELVFGLPMSRRAGQEGVSIIFPNILLGFNPLRSLTVEIDALEAVKGAARELDDGALRVAIENITSAGNEPDKEEIGDLIREVASLARGVLIVGDNKEELAGLFEVVARLSEYTDVAAIDDRGMGRHTIREFETLSRAFHASTGGHHLRPIDQLNRRLQRDPANGAVHIKNYLGNGYNINTVMLYPRADRTVGETPLFNLLIAQEYFTQDALDLLLKYSFASKTLDVNTRDSEEKTGLTLAAKVGNAKLTTRLLENTDKLRAPIELDAQDKDGRTAMHYAYLYGDMVTIHALKKAGARLDLLDKDRRTPEDLLRLDISEAVPEIVSTLASIEIDAYRFECARHNADTECPDTERTLLDRIKDQRREALESLVDVSKGKGV